MQPADLDAIHEAVFNATQMPHEGVTLHSMGCSFKHDVSALINAAVDARIAEQVGLTPPSTIEDADKALFDAAKTWNSSIAQENVTEIMDFAVEDVMRDRGAQYIHPGSKTTKVR